MKVKFILLFIKGDIHMNETISKNNDLNARIKQNNKQIFIWTFLWLISTALLAFGPKLLWSFALSVTLPIIIVNLVFGVKMILVNIQHLKDMDELQRRVHLNAMGISLGASMILGSLMGLLEPAGVIDFTPSPANVLFVMGISYMVTVFLNFRKYQ